jgi:2-iminobutanoate/2-iminopropanoate deaminase
MFPYNPRWLSEEHRAELLREAEGWRLARTARIHASKRIRRWIPLLPWRRASVRSAPLLVSLDTPPCEPMHAPHAPQRDSLDSSVLTVNGRGSGEAVPPGFPFNLAGQASGLCFISGMPALDPDGKFVPGTFAEEARLAWQNVAAAAAASGCSIDDIVYVQCVLSDIEDYGDLNAWWRGQFPNSWTAPARFTFQAGALPFGAKIEIQAIATHRA